MSGWPADPPLSDEDLEHLLDVHPLAQVAVLEIRQFRQRVAEFLSAIVLEVQAHRRSGLRR